MTSASYGHTRHLNELTFEQALEKVTLALKAEGFGVLTEIDVKETLKKKLNVDFVKYKILGACNPQFAHQALSQEPLLGLLLPCNVTVFEEQDGSINVSFIKPTEMFKVVQNPELQKIGEQVEEKLTRALQAL
jgi:uncharacterized protein (DUF302 family)